MLQSIRDRASGIVAYVIIILISIPFALWGINEYFGGGEELVAAEVNGNEIPMRAFSSEFQQRQRSLRSMFGNRPPPQYSDAVLKEAVIADLVRRELVREEVERAGYRVSDEVVANEIRSIPVFQVDGAFDPARYEQLLQTQRRSKAEFEAGLRQEIRVGEFEGGVRDTAFVTPGEASDFNRLRNQERDLVYLVYEADADAARVTITDAQVSEYYNGHQDQFKTPEKVRIEYVRVSEEDLQKQVGVDEETLLAQYEEQMDRYVSAEERRARHILIPFDSNAGDEEINTARTRAQEIRDRIVAGEDFGQLAREFSGDELTSAAGGDLGLLVRGDMSPEFDKVLFSLQKDEVSEPVQVASGFEIVQVTGITPSEQKSFESVRSLVEEDYRQREAERRFVEMTERMLTLAYEQPDSLEPVAGSLGMPVETSEWITRAAGEGIGSEPAVRDAAFSNEVYTNSRNSDLLELPDGSVLVLRVADRDASRVLPLEDVREEIVETLSRQEAARLAAKQGDAAIAELRQGGDPESVATASGARIVSPGHVRRDASAVDPQIRSALFRMPGPGQGSVSLEGVEMADGAYTVIVLRGIREDTGAGEEGANRSKALASSFGSRELNAAIADLETGAKIHIFRENL